jgi:outer membrane receptor protein involved in Fe transport
MTKSKSLDGVRKFLLGSTAVLAGAVSLSVPAAAQEAPEPDDTIIVTGSRIARDANVAAPSPITTVTAADITESGVFNTADVLADLPALQFSTTSEGSLGVNSGQNTLNLRGMGEARTLTLVNGRRFVAGVEGTQSVDVGSIPQALIERVEVMTGGASAVYGADAVTGVVNFVLRDDFEGLDINFRGGLSGEGDGEEYSGTVLIGENFAGGRGNVTATLGFQSGSAITIADRPHFGDLQISTGADNPALRFQQGEINASATPNLANWYDLSNGYFGWGHLIPSQADFVTEYTNQFGSAPTLTSAEIALFNRASGASPLAILPGANFSITSVAGMIKAGNNFFNGVDLDSNGVDDCQQSFTGFNSTFEGGPDAFGLGPFGFNSYGDVGGCWVAGAGGPRVIQDGLVASDFNQFGGDGYGGTSDGLMLTPQEQRFTFTVAGRYEISPALRVFSEVFYSRHEVDFRNPYNTFYDLLYGAPDNPFLPTQLQALATSTGGLYITRDMIDLGDNTDTDERETVRLVAGGEGEFANGWSWEASANYGRFQQTTIDRNKVLLDRFFAAIDVVDIGAGPECRSNTDLTAPPATPYNIPRWDSGFYTFTPGDGQCAPADIWNGVGGISQEAIDFITVTAEDKQTITQSVFHANLVGDTEDWFSLQGGAIAFAIGGEWRRETSKFESDVWDRGILPKGSPFGAGSYVGDYSNNNSLGFSGGDSVSINSRGSYDVYDLFGEISVPVLADLPFADELTVDAAYRFSDYSTVGTTDTWRIGAVWAPIEDVRLRASQSQSVRAPNINELFSPTTPAFYRPTDPCGVAQINALAALDAVAGQLRNDNCATALAALGVADATDGSIDSFTGTLSARFPGTVSGNANLSEETAETLTYGFVMQPRFVPGLTVSLDYWDIELTDPINLLSQQDVVDNCYDSATLSNEYCAQIVRSNVAGPTAGLLIGLNLTYTNLMKIEADGIDLAARYAFSLGDNRFSIGLQATQQRTLDFFFDPLDPNSVDPELGELQRPEYTGLVSLGYDRDSFGVSWRTQYIGEQLIGGGGIVGGAEIESYQSQYGDAAMGEAIYLHNLSARFDFGERATFFGGVDNVTDELPYRTVTFYPSSARGRFFYLGVTSRW